MIFVDGECVLCDRLTQWLLRIDKHRRLSFATLQGETAQRAFSNHSSIEALRGEVSTLIYVRQFETAQQRIYVRSTGALMALWDIGGAWRLLGPLRIIPTPIRNMIYRWIASNRYRWFGKKKSACLLPSPEHQSRFLT